MTTGFIVLAAGAVLAAIAFAIVPLLTGAERPERRAPALILALVLLIPALAWFAYQHVGTPEGITPQDADVTTIRGSLIELARRLERNPDDVESWVRLGLAYKELQEYSSAEHALRRALFIDEDNAFIRVELAETLLFASGRPQLPDGAKELLREALTHDPGQHKALWLMGLDAFQRGDNVQAVSWFERLEAALPEGSVRNTVRDYLGEARNRAGMASEARPSPERVAAVRVAVEVDEALQERISGEETVYIIVRNAEVPGPPLAVHRFSARELPIELEFDEDDRMMAGSNIGDAPSLRITARISRSGAAEARPGDLEGDSGILRAEQRLSASVTINREI